MRLSLRFIIPLVLVLAGFPALALAQGNANPDLVADCRALTPSEAAEPNRVANSASASMTRTAAASDSTADSNVSSVVARTTESKNAEEGISLFLVPTSTKGVSVTLLPTMDQTRKLSEAMCWGRMRLT